MPARQRVHNQIFPTKHFRIQRFASDSMIVYLTGRLNFERIAASQIAEFCRAFGGNPHLPA
jgi:hypothetical protein